AAVIHEQMALTRSALAEKLEKLKGCLLGESGSSTKGDTKIMPSTRARSQAKDSRTGRRPSSSKKATSSLASARKSSRKKSGTKKSALSGIASKSGLTK